MRLTSSLPSTGGTAASPLGRFAPQLSSILSHNTVKLAASKAMLELTAEVGRGVGSGGSSWGGAKKAETARA